MRDRLIIRLLNGHSDNVSWITVSEEGKPLSQEHYGSLSEVSEIAAGRHVTLMASGRDVIISSAELPDVKRNKLSQMVPYALEDVVSEDIDNLHFGVGGRDETGRFLVAIASKEYMEHWKEAIREAGIRTHEIVPEVLCLPYQEGEWAILIDPDEVLIRTGQNSGFASDRDNFADVIGLAINQLAELERPERLRIFDYSGSDIDIEELEQLPDIEIEFDDSSNEESSTYVLATGVADVPAVNMLSGDFSQEQEYSKLWAPWKPLAALIVIVLLFSTVSGFIKKGKLEDRRDALVSQMKKVAREVLSLSPTKPISLAKSEKKIRSRLNQLRGGAGDGDFIDFLHPIAKKLKDSKAEVSSIVFRGDTMEIIVEMRSINSINRLGDRLKTPGFTVEVDSAESSKGRRATGTLKIKREKR